MRDTRRMENGAGFSSGLAEFFIVNNLLYEFPTPGLFGGSDGPVNRIRRVRSGSSAR